MTVILPLLDYLSTTRKSKDIHDIQMVVPPMRNLNKVSIVSRVVV